jgi:hypothetical protein
MTDFTEKDIENFKIALKKLAESLTGDESKAVKKTLAKLGNDSKKAAETLNAFASQTGKTTRAAKELEGSFGKLGNAKEKYYTVLDGADRKLSFFTDGFGRNLANLFGSSLAGTVFAVLQEQTNVYRELVDVGQTFNGNMLNMNRAAFNAGLTLDQFAGLVKQAGESAALLGMARFADLNKNVRVSLMQFGSFGMSIQEVNESFANYVESQRISGTIQQFTNQELQQGFQSLAENSAFYAELTGKSAKELRAATVDVRNNAIGFQAFLQTLPNAMRSSVQRQFDSVTTGLVAVFGESGRRLSQELGDSLAFGSAAFSETARTLNMVAPQVGSSLQELVEANRSGTLTEERRTAIMGRVVQDLGNLGPATMQQLAMLQNHPAHREFATQIIQMAAAARSQRDMTEEQRDVQRRQEALRNRFNDTTEQLLNQQQEFQLATAQFKLLFVNIINPLFTVLGPALNVFNIVLGKVGSTLNSIFETLPEFAQVGIGVVGVMALLLPAFRGLVMSVTRATAALMGLGGGGFGGAAAGAAGAAGGGRFGRLGGMLGGVLGGGGAAGAGTAGGFGGLGGLAALAKPLAIVGVVIGGVTIAMMGLGKALEWAGTGVNSMADGFKKMSEINAGGLGEFAKAAASLGGVLAGGGLGAMVGGLATSIGNMFGGRDAQISSFERLAAAGPGLSLVSSALNDMKNLDLSGGVAQVEQMASAIERMSSVGANIPQINLPEAAAAAPSPMQANDSYRLVTSMDNMLNRMEELIDLTRSGNVTRDDLTTAVRRMR